MLIIRFNREPRDLNFSIFTAINLNYEIIFCILLCMPGCMVNKIRLAVRYFGVYIFL